MDVLVSYTMMVEYAEKNDVLFVKLFHAFHYLLLNKQNVVIP